MAGEEEKQSSDKPSIEGTNKLVSGRLPDGTAQVQPILLGLMTFTKTHRNFNFVAMDDEFLGTFFTLITYYDTKHYDNEAISK